MRKFLIVCLITLAVLALCAGCKNKDKNAFAAVAAPILVDTLQDFVNDPDSRKQLGDGAPVLDVLSAYCLPRLRNRFAGLATGDEKDQAWYKLLYEIDPVLAYMWVREQNGEKRGLGPRLEVWLKDKGYLGQMSLSEGFFGGSLLKVKLSDADRDELIRLGTAALIEEYEAVKVLAKAEPGPGI